LSSAIEKITAFGASDLGGTIGPRWSLAILEKDRLFHGFSEESIKN
jgi:hypothetical protein